MKSVFTHIRPPEAENYLREVARLLKSGGRCLATFFLLNEAQRTLAAEGRNKLNFDFGEGAWRYVYEHSPESAAAYEEEYILRILIENELKMQRLIHYGTWTGRQNGLSFQDMIVAQKD